MKNTFILIAALLIFSACNPQKKEEKTDLKTQVMDVHDEVMPKMGELRQTRKQLLVMADSSAASDSLVSTRYRELANQIEVANESMMDWMRNYDPNFDGSEEDIKEYLEQQLADIKKVRSDMLESFEKGKQAIEN